MFKPVDPKLNLPWMEETVLNLWKLGRIFHKYRLHRMEGPRFVHYEIPRTANVKPDMQDAFAYAVQDVFLRYKSMRGFNVVRRGAWDAHGLPVEVGVERQLGISGKSQIEDYGVERFNQSCREAAFEFIQYWQRFSDRIAYWVDFEDAYVTFTDEYIESVWWILKTLWEKDLLHQSFNAFPYCPRCGTTLSEQQAGLGLREVEDPSVYVRLLLVDEPGTSLLAWTTSPWTLPGNVAAAVHPDAEYAAVQRSMPEGGRERLIVASSQVDAVFGDEPVRVVDTFKGKRLKGKRYQPLFTFIHIDKPCHFVVLRDSIPVGQGTGLVDVAPAFDAQDLNTALEFDLPVVMTIAEDGTFLPEVRPWSGQFVKDADPYITQDLAARGLLYRAESVKHTQHFCIYCQTPLLNYARGAWSLRTSQVKERIEELSQEINWIPEQVENELPSDGLAGDRDWLLTRERTWGTPLPVWECRECRHQIVVGSVSELSNLAGRDLSETDLHRPSLDKVTFPCPECIAPARGTMVRLPEVVDAWFDAGSAPVAAWHFPFENQETFREQRPADFICEPARQAGGWLYSLFTISALLFDGPAFKNVVRLEGQTDAEAGESPELSHSRSDPLEAINKYGADTFRWSLYSASQSSQARRFSLDLVQETLHGFIQPLWEVYAYFVAYAVLDHWSPGGQVSSADRIPDLDRWLRSRLGSLVRVVSESLGNFDLTRSALEIQAFVHDLNRWYLRRIRQRFWKNSTGEDRDSAYAMLYETLVTLSKLLAPYTPFLAESLYQNLVRVFDPRAPQSVHMCDWPEFDESSIDESLDTEMEAIKKLTSLGLAAREKVGINLYQPLSEALFVAGKNKDETTIGKYAELLMDGLNVKGVRALEAEDGEISIEGVLVEHPSSPDDIRVEIHSGLVYAAEGSYLTALKTGLNPDLQEESLARQFVQQVQVRREEADFGLAERIRLVVEATPGLKEAIEKHRELVKGETQADGLDWEETPEDVVTAEAWFAGEWMKAGIVKS